MQAVSPVLFNGKPSALPTCQRQYDSKIMKNESGTSSRNKSARHLRSSLFGKPFLATEYHILIGIMCRKSGQTLQRQVEFLLQNLTEALQSLDFSSITQFFLHILFFTFLPWFTFRTDPLQMSWTSKTFLPLFLGLTHLAQLNLG